MVLQEILGNYLGLTLAKIARIGRMHSRKHRKGKVL